VSEQDYEKLLQGNPDIKVTDSGKGIPPAAKGQQPASIIGNEVWHDYPKPKKRHKYGAVKTTVDSFTFDSKKEARRYVELKHMAGRKEIQGLELQPEYILQPAYTTHDGKRVRPIAYVGDFQYWEGEQCVVEDVKGMQTPVFKIKAKMFRFKYPGIKLVIT
jgi:hypothetical protein